MVLNSPSNPITIRGGTHMYATETITPVLAGTVSTIFDARGLKDKTYYLRNTSNRAITVQARARHTSGSSVTFNVGSVVNLADGSSTPTTAYVALTEFHPYIEFLVTAVSSDSTTGSMTIDISAFRY